MKNATTAKQTGAGSSVLAGAASTENATMNIVGLEWYRNRFNNGRGRISAEDKRLIKQGLLKVQWVSMKCWVISITEKGKAALPA